MKTISKILITASLFIGLAATSQTLPQALSKINTEGFQKSQVMNLISDLSDVYGPRITGTNQYYTAAESAKKTIDNRKTEQTLDIFNFLVGHSSTKTAEINTHVANRLFMEIKICNLNALTEIYTIVYIQLLAVIKTKR
jgi:hypothetical protein